MKNEGGAHGDGPCLNLQGIKRLEEMGFLIVLYQDLEQAAEKHAMAITGDSSRTLLQPSEDLQFHRFTKAASYFPTSKKTHAHRKQDQILFKHHCYTTEIIQK